MRYPLLTLAIGLIATQGACSHPGRDVEAAPRAAHGDCGCPHDGPPPHAFRDGPPSPWHRGPAFDANVTLGLQEVLPMLHVGPHGPPPHDLPPPPFKALARSFDFNDVVTITQDDGIIVTRGVRGNVQMHDANGVPSLDGNVNLLGVAAGKDGSATLQLIGLTGNGPGPGPGHCLWPTAGTVVRTNADGSVHRLVFGATCEQATLDGKAVTLPGFPFPPFHGPHGHHPPMGPGGHGGPDEHAGACEHGEHDGPGDQG